MTAASVPVAPDLPPGPAPRPLTVYGLLLLDPQGHDPTRVDSITFDDGGIGVVRSRGQSARVLPWEAVVAHAVEPWAGGVFPGWWLEPEESRTGQDDPTDGDPAGAPLPTVRTTRGALPHAEAGAMISIQTRTGTYRFLRTGGDTTELAARIAEFTVRHRGPAGVSTVTTVAARRGGRAARSTWARVQPWLVALLVVLIVAAVTVILLQSAGVVHLPILGSGGASGGGAAPAGAVRPVT